MAKQGSKAKKRILKAKIDFLSLCPRGANTLQTVYKDENGQEQNISLSVLSKGMNDQGELIACVYCPELVDSQGDVASAEVIKEMAYDFAVNGQGIDIRHNNQSVPKDQAFVAESFIIQKADPRFADMKTYAGEAVDVTGGWGTVVKIENEELRKLYKSGEWGGISMGGLMLTKAESDEGAISRMCAAIAKAFGKNLPKDTEIDMDAKDLKPILEENNKALVAAFKEALKPAAPGTPEPVSKEQQPALTLGMGYPKPCLKEGASEAEISRFEKEMEIYELSKAVDRSNLQSIRDFQVMAKQIATGKESTSGSPASPYGSFFATNQEVKKSVEGDKSVADAILAELEKEEKEAAKV